MLNDDEHYCCDWRDSAPIEYITESEDYYSYENEQDDFDLDDYLDDWDDQDYNTDETIKFPIEDY